MRPEAAPQAHYFSGTASGGVLSMLWYFAWPNWHSGPSGQKPARYLGQGFLRVCRLRQRGPCLQKPRPNHGHSWT